MLKALNGDVLLLILLVVRLGLDSDIQRMSRWQREPEIRSVRLGPTYAYTQAIFHLPDIHEYPHPKSVEQNELDEAAILFNRLHYFNTLRSRREDVITWMADDSDSGLGSPDNSDSEGQLDGHPEQQSRTQTMSEEDALQLSREDMDLIEILWKQDIDLGVRRDAYDFGSSDDVEKLKQVEITNEKDLCSNDSQVIEEIDVVPDPLAGLNYTIDSETGEYLIEGLSDFEDIESTFFDEQILKENVTDSVANDAFLPTGANDEFCDLSEVFSPTQFEQMLPEDLSLDSDYLSQIEDLEKELVAFETLESENGTNVQTGEMYPSMEDGWPDSTTMLPLPSLGSTHQAIYPPLSPRPLHGYINLDDNIPFPTVPQSRQNESFLSMLQGSSLEVPPEEEFHPISSTVGPSSIGCAVAESIATLTNDTDPIPPHTLMNTAYSSEWPELLYTNHTATVPHNDMLMSDLILDEDLQLVDVLSNNHKEKQNEEHMDTSSDSISLASGQLPSVSDCDNESRSFGEEPYEMENCNDQQYFTLKSYYADPSETSACSSTERKLNLRKFDLNNPRSNGLNSSSFMHHNHTYHIPFTNDDSHYKPHMRDKSKNSSDDDSSNKDEKRAKELKIPISIDDIINLAIDEYNERLSKYELSEKQLSLIRDIRRRGKNKVAAQNCRKRKQDQIANLQQDLGYLQRDKLQLNSKKSHLLKQKNLYEDKYAQLYNLILQSTNSIPPDPPRNVHMNRNRIGISTNPDLIIVEEDSDPNRGARAKRKYKK